MACNVFFSCAGGIKEGFQIVGAAVDYALELPNAVASSESSSDPSNVFKDLENNYVDTSEPFPSSTMSIFADNNMGPECCPAAYSGSTGCVCATPEQMKFISQRGGNKTLNGDF